MSRGLVAGSVALAVSRVACRIHGNRAVVGRCGPAIVEGHLTTAEVFGEVMRDLARDQLGFGVQRRKRAHEATRGGIEAARHARPAADRHLVGVRRACIDDGWPTDGHTWQRGPGGMAACAGCARVGRGVAREAGPPTTARERRANKDRRGQNHQNRHQSIAFREIHYDITYFPLT